MTQRHTFLSTLLILLSTTVGGGMSEAAVVTAIDGTGSLTIVDAATGVSVPDTEFPQPGRTYTLVEAGTAGGTFTLTNSTALPGTCTNFGSPQDVSNDFVLSGNQLTARDCGGTATVQSGSGKVYKLPADQDNDGLPDWWERQESSGLSSTQCPAPATCIDPNVDNEMLGSNLNSGDGFANVDEYRGFMVSGKPIRTKSTQKDIFVHLVNPQCSKATGTTLPTGGLLDSLIGKAAADTRLIYPTASPSTSLNAGKLFDSFLAIGGGSTPAKVNLLGYVENGLNQSTTEWLDNFDRLDGLTAIYKTGTDGPVSDRQVNVNAIRRPTDPVTQLPIVQKGIRVIECLNNLVNSPLGYAIFPPNTPVGNPDQETNSVIYTQRIWKDFEQVLNYASSKGATSAYKTCALNNTCVYFQTYKFGFSSNGTPTTTYDPPSPLLVNRNFVVSKYMQYILGMEAGHSVALIPVLQIAQYGAHYAPGNGDNLDQRIIAKDSSRVGSGGVIYYIPTTYSSKSNNCFQLKNGNPTC